MKKNVYLSGSLAWKYSVQLLVDVPSVVAQCMCACHLSLLASTADSLPLPAACYS